MDREFLEQIHAEMIVSFSEALAIVVAGMVRSMDAQTVTENLRHQIQAAQLVGPDPDSLAIRIACESLAAAEAEFLHQSQPSH